MNIEKHHEDFCKVFKPKYGTIFNINTSQFEPLDDCFYEDAKMLNWAFSGWTASVSREGYKMVPVEPTHKMILAGYEEGCYAQAIYKAMLGAVE